MYIFILMKKMNLFSSKTHITLRISLINIINNLYIYLYKLPSLYQGYRPKHLDSSNKVRSQLYGQLSHRNNKTSVSTKTITTHTIPKSIIKKLHLEIVKPPSMSLLWFHTKECRSTLYKFAEGNLRFPR